MKYILEWPDDVANEGGGEDDWSKDEPEWGKEDSEWVKENASWASKDDWEEQVRGQKYTSFKS